MIYINFPRKNNVRQSGTRNITYLIPHQTNTQKMGKNRRLMSNFEILIIFLSQFVCVLLLFFRLAVNTFATEAERAQLDLTADNEEEQKLQMQIKKWDRKKKKMITVNNVRRFNFFK